jgi:hypothetical protein
MYVQWNREEPGFQNCWLWQFGEGPFEVLEVHRVPPVGGRVGGGIDFIQSKFEPGYWYYIRVPNCAYQYRVEYGLESVLFHSKWFVETSLSSLEEFYEESGKTPEQFVENLKQSSHGYVEGEKWVHIESRFDYREKLKSKYPFVTVIHGYDFELEAFDRWLSGKLGKEGELWDAFGLSKTGYDYFFQEFYFLNEDNQKEFERELPKILLYI